MKDKRKGVYKMLQATRNSEAKVRPVRRKLKYSRLERFTPEQMKAANENTTRTRSGYDGSESGSKEE